MHLCITLLRPSKPFMHLCILLMHVILHEMQLWWHSCFLSMAVITTYLHACHHYLPARLQPKHKMYVCCRCPVSMYRTNPQHFIPFHKQLVQCACLELEYKVHMCCCTSFLPCIPSISSISFHRTRTTSPSHPHGHICGSISAVVSILAVIPYQLWFVNADRETAEGRSSFAERAPLQATVCMASCLLVLAVHSRESQACTRRCPRSGESASGVCPTQLLGPRWMHPGVP